MAHFFVLDEDGNPLPLEREDILLWGRWMENHPAQRIVSQDTVVNKNGEDVQVSTVFLGINHNYFGEDPPILWETMIFGGPHDQRQWRYSSRKAAMDGHVRAMALVFGLGEEDES